MNTAKLVNSALTGGGLIYPENLNVVIGSENKGYPKGTVLDANATLSLAGQSLNNSTNGLSSNNCKADKFIEDFNIGKTTYVDKSDGQVYQSIDLNQSFEKGKAVTSNIHIGGASNNKYKYIPRSIGEIQLGDFSDSTGINNIIVGEFAKNIGNYNIISSSVSIIDVAKIDGNDNLCLKTTRGKLFDYLVENKCLAFSVKYAFTKSNNIYSSVIIDNYDEQNNDFCLITNFTRLDDTTVQVNDDRVKFLKQYDGCLVYMVYNTNNNVIAGGKYIYNQNAANSIFSGMGLCSLGSKKINGVSAFGIKNTVYNDGEFACGINNISNTFTKDGNGITTQFSIGGNINNSKSNCIEVTVHKNNNIVNKSSLYVYGIGGYDGTNVSDANTKSLQQVISDIETAQTYAKFGNTADRPADATIGLCYFDTTLNKPIWCKTPMQDSTAAKWVDALGNEI